MIVAVISVNFYIFLFIYFFLFTQKYIYRGTSTRFEPIASAFFSAAVLYHLSYEDPYTIFFAAAAGVSNKS